MLSVNNISCKKILQDISLSLEYGEIAGIIGSAGAGKSLFLKAIYGDASINKGTVLINEKNLHKMKTKEKMLSVSASHIVTIENLSDTVYNFLLLSRFPYKPFFGPFSESDHDTVENYISRFSLETYRNNVLGSLPGSILKLVFLAWAFAREAPLLILDNPGEGLNPLQMFKLMDTITRYTIDGKKGVLIASNDINIISQCADRILVIDGGKIVKEGDHSIITVELIEKIFNCQVLISKNIYNGRPEVHIFPFV